MVNSLTNTLPAEQLDIFKKFAEKINSLDAGFLVFDAAGQCILEAQENRPETESELLKEYAQQACQNSPSQIQKFGPSDNIIIGIIENDEMGILVAVIDTGISEITDDEDLAKSSREINFLTEMLSTFTKDFNSSSRAQEQLEMVSSELAQTYEELMILYNLSTNMKVTQSNATYLQLACDQITQLINVEGIAVFLEKNIEEGKQIVLTAGSGCISIDNSIADILMIRLVEELISGNEALLDSNVDSPLKYDWPDSVKNIIAIPLQGSGKIIGMMVATNVLNKPDFDSIDVKLFNSVANQCTVFIENGRLFGDLKELFIGSLKALTNSIDAKDQYTRGHSERVAFISRWIADRYSEQHPIDEEQIHTIYLAGLLHDIGKIGIDEAVLRKKERLTPEDINHIKAHPQIGAGILADIKQMKKVVPGVLYHHERVDGTGYPEALCEDEIPLSGKIVGLADTFDAMTSRRVYRDAMSVGKAVEEIKMGLGKQFDEKVANVFINSDINKLWDIIQDGFIESWDYSNFAEYGATAVGTLIK